MDAKPLTQGERRFVEIHIGTQADIAKREIYRARYGDTYDAERLNEIGLMVNELIAEYFSQ